MMIGTTASETNADAAVAARNPAARLKSSDPAGWSAVNERSNVVTLRFMVWFALVCGRRAARWLLHPITLYFMLFAPTPRRHARRFYSRVLGYRASWRTHYRHVHHFASTVLDRVYLLRGRYELFDLQVDGADRLDAVLAEGRGAFLLGAHMGSFEVLRSVGLRHGEPRIAMVMYPDNARMINAALAAIAPDNPPAVIALGRSGSTLEIRDWLDAGGLAGMLGDRTLPGESARAATLSVPFLGHDASFSDGPFRLAALLKRPVVFMVGLYRGGNRYDVRFETIADFSRRPASSEEREQQIADAVLAYATRLEALCREAPDNWFNFYDFWGDDAR